MSKGFGLTLPEGSAVPQELLTFIDERVGDGNLSKGDLEEVLAEVRRCQESNVLSEEELHYVGEYTKKKVAESQVNAKVPVLLKVLAVLGIAVGALLSFLLLIAMLGIVLFLEEDMVQQYSVTYLIVLGIDLAGNVAFFVLSVVLGVRLLRNKRRGAAVLLHVMSVLAALGIVTEIMLSGITSGLAFPAVAGILCVVMSAYLDNSLLQERKLDKQLALLDTENRAKAGTLGLDLKGGGFIKLDFFNLFWIFVIGCVVGDIVECIFHMVIVDPGVYQERAGVLYGPFSPIYGFGALLMTLALNRFRKANVLVVFVVCTVIGGAFEAFTSVFMEVGFGVTAWDYSDQWLGWLFGGRTCPLYAAMFGVLGVAWIKLFMPSILKLVNLIPWKWRYGVTAVCGVLMAINCVMTLQALDCWYERACGKAPETAIERFYAENYDDDWMQNRFQTMTIIPDNSARGDSAAGGAA